MAPMNYRLKERLLPTLMEGWEGLRRLEVRGVSWEVMRTLTVNGVDLTVSKEARECDNGAVTCQNPALHESWASTNETGKGMKAPTIFQIPQTA